MANKNNTREDIHSGLSETKSEQKWSDMLNFRSANNRTYVIPRKKKLYELPASFHTVIRGIGELAYAIGSRGSYVFRGREGVGIGKLWRARLVRDVDTDDQSENLKVRGSYLGTVPRVIRLTVVDGRLVRDVDWPEEPVEEVEAMPNPSLFCGKVYNRPELELAVTFLPYAPEWNMKFRSFATGAVVASYPEGVAFDPYAHSYYYCATGHSAEDFSTIDGDPYIDFENSIPTTSAPWVICQPYDSGGIWVEGEVVFLASGIYKCLASHGPYPSFVPGGSGAWSTVWQKLANLFSPPQLIGKDNYNIGEYATKAAVTYKSISNHAPNYTNDPPSAAWTTVTSEPARAAEVSVYNGLDLVTQGVTNAQGLLKVNLLPGTYRIRVEAEGMQMVETEIVKDADPQTETIQLQQLA